MKNLKIHLSLLLVLGAFFSLKAQSIENKINALEKYNADHLQEKLYLQLDKYAYTAGEKIWFKAYNTLGIDNHFSNVSGIAYVELIDASKRKIDSLIIPILMGVGLGEISLSDTITEGSYRLRAYTNWMRNSDDKYFYDRTIQISNGRTDNVTTYTTVQPGDKTNTVTVKLQGLSGVPLSKVNVRYEIIYEGKSVQRKRGTTDESGNLILEVPAKYSDAKIGLRFENNTKVIVNKLIALPNINVSKGYVHLLPEGGKLLEGFINTIGIKSINDRGLGEPVKVWFTNGKDTLGNYETNQLGMGAVNLYLNPGDSLLGFAKYSDGSVQRLDVPKIQSSGYNLHVNNLNENKLFAQINVSKDLVNQSEVYFLIQHLGKIFYLSKQKLNKQELTFAASKANLPSGVLTISILNSNFEPLIERPIFVFNKSYLLPLEMSLNKEVFGHREKVNVDLSVLGNDTLKLSALSASVLNVSKIQDNPYTAPNILSGLLLSSDLKGYIENSGFYFENNELKATDMDFLMLTQGWRNVDWSSLDKPFNPLFVPEKSLSISGYIKKLGRSKSEPGAKVQIMPTKNLLSYLDTISNEDGYFVFDNLLFPDSTKFLIIAKDGKGKSNVDVIYNRPLMLKVGVNKNEADEKWDINNLYKDELAFSKDYFLQLESVGLKQKAIAIEEVVVRGVKKSKASQNSSNLNGSGNADQIITADDLSTCVSLEMCLAGRLLGVTWQGGVPYNTRGNVPMQVVLDGMFIEADQLSMVNVADVESIEVLRSVNYTAIYGSNGGGGLLIITSKTGSSAMNNYKPAGIVAINPKGLHQNGEFYKPKYDVIDRSSPTQDLRTLIHWEPSIVTTEKGKANFDFFTADEKGTYLIVIEGLDLNGKICREIKTIEIK